MNDLQIFTNEQFGNVRTIVEGETVLFCGSDIAKALGYTNPSKALSDHCKGVTKRYTPTVSGKQEMSFILEGDVYRLIVRSYMPEAERFEKWLFEEVLPTIRKHGMYAKDELLDNPELLIEVATRYKEERDKRIALEAQNATLLPKADYFDNLVDRRHMTSLRETAKELNVGERFFISSLLDADYLYRNRFGILLPQNNRNKGYFVVKDCWNKQNGYTGVQTLVTVEGKKFLLGYFGGLA